MRRTSVLIPHTVRTSLVRRVAHGAWCEVRRPRCRTSRDYDQARERGDFPMLLNNGHHPGVPEAHR